MVRDGDQAKITIETNFLYLMEVDGPPIQPPPQEPAQDAVSSVPSDTDSSRDTDSSHEDWADSGKRSRSLTKSSTI